MEMLRAALLGCLLTGGVLFGARPPTPERRLLRETARTAGPGRLGLSAEELARWVRPLAAPVTLDDLRVTAPPPLPSAWAMPPAVATTAHRRRCAAERCSRRKRL